MRVSLLSSCHAGCMHAWGPHDTRVLCCHVQQHDVARITACDRVYCHCSTARVTFGSMNYGADSSLWTVDCAAHTIFAPVLAKGFAVSSQDKGFERNRSAANQ
jgi:hypothetical protein